MVRQFTFDGIDRLDLMGAWIIGGAHTRAGSGLERVPIKIGVPHRVEVQTHDVPVGVVVHEVLERLGDRWGGVRDHEMPVVVIGQRVHEERGHVPLGQFLPRVAFRLDGPIRPVLVQGDQVDAGVRVSLAQFLGRVVP